MDEDTQIADETRDDEESFNVTKTADGFELWIENADGSAAWCLSEDERVRLIERLQS
jgi:hypothetical protein